MKVEAEGDLKELIETDSNRRYRDVARNIELLDGLKRAIELFASADDINAIKAISFLHYEKLKYELSGLSSVRLSNRYVHRLIFEEKDDLITLKLIEIDDTHYGNKK